MIAPKQPDEPEKKGKRAKKKRAPAQNKASVSPEKKSVPPESVSPQAQEVTLPGDKKSFGRPSKLTRKLFDKIILAYALGATDEQVSALFDLAPSVISLWKAQPYFMEAITRAKEGTDEKVEGMLLRRAMGFDYAETTMERVKEKDAEGNLIEKMVATKIVKRHIPPDVYAQIFWLKNRRKSRWRDKEETGPPQLANVTINNIMVQAPPVSGNGAAHEVATHSPSKRLEAPL